MVAKGMLLKLGCRVSLAENGEEALQQLAQQRPDLILMDCNMPIMDGYEAISERMDLRLEKLAMETILAATDAARRAIEKSHAETSSAARDYAKAAGEARREAWRYFGGFWVWLASVGAGGAVLGLLTAFLIMGRGDAREFGQYPQVYCTTAGGQIVEQDDGSSFCAIWIDRPSQSGG
jgi:CheY-like chemotaxis protein